MATESPTWLDASHMQKILQNSEKDKSIEVRSIIVKPAMPKGENYGSDMYRAAVQFSRVQDAHEIQEERSFIVKAAYQGETRQELLDRSEIFDMEFSMISVTLPEMDDMLVKLGCMSLAPRHFYIQYELPTHAVIEDLAPRGFRMSDRRVGLDLDHSLLTLQNLGRFHAASIALKEKDPKALMKYKKGLLHKDQPDIVRAYFNSSAKAFANEVAKWPEINPRISEKLLKLSEVLYEKGCEAVLYREDDLNVLNHGDCWTNNMMFRYNEQQKPIDHKFVDFQNSHYGSAAFDLLYFLATSPTDDVGLHHREELLREYHASLTRTMIKLKCETEVPSFDKLQEILRERAFCEVAISVGVLPFVVVEKGDEIEVTEALKLDEEFNNARFRGKKYRKIMTRLLPLFDSSGLLDA